MSEKQQARAAIDWNKALIQERPDYEGRIVPTADWVLIKRDRSDKTEGGIVLPEATKAKYQRLGNFEVISCGPGKWREGGFAEMQFKPGDRVMPDPQAPCYSMPQDEHLMLIREEHLLAKVLP